jgi:hypothetical protein
VDAKIKLGQVTIWIILAVFLVAAIAIFLLLSENSVMDIIPKKTSSFSVNSYLSNCVGQEVRKATAIMLPQGGFVNPTDFRLFNKTSVEYICETKSYFEPCINQHPVLISEMEDEILDFISPGVGECFNGLQQEIEHRGGEIVFNSAVTNIDVELEYDEVVVNIKRDMSTTEKDLKNSYGEFNIEVKSSAYNLGVVAQEIANQEASSCYFETAGYNLAYPRYKVTRQILSDQSKIYIIRDKKIDETMTIAIRSCALPEGMPG